MDGDPGPLVVRLPAGVARAVEEPESEPTVRGPREGFVEQLYTNLALVRRRIRTPDLHVRILTIGERTHTRVAVVHIHGVAEEATVREVLRRLEQIRIDGVLESGYVEEFIQDHYRTLFPTIGHTERVDVVLGNLLDGRVAVLTDGTPFALVAPATLFSLLQVGEDYYERWPAGTFIRWVRYIAMVITLTITAFFVAVASFNQELIPVDLALRVAGNPTGLPLPAAAEGLMMELAFEVLREAGLRMPRPIGQAISIVGVLVLGEAAVRAGIVGPVMIMTVGAGALSSFAIPDYSLGNAVRMLRFGMILLAGTFGLFGLVWGLLALITHLLTLKSFGVPYTAPLTPLGPRGLFQDAWLRLPWPQLRRRPGRLARDVRRQPPGPTPAPRQELSGARRQ